MSTKQKNAIVLVFCDLERCNTAIVFLKNLSLKRKK